MLTRYEDQWRLTSQTGTGPFRLQTYVQGSHIEWERNPTYYDSRYPYVDCVTQVILPDRVRQRRDAQAGNVHLWAPWPTVSLQQKDELKQSCGDAIQLDQQPLNTVWVIHLNPDQAPFRQPEMRRAAHLALDRQALFEAAYAGAGVPCAILDPGVYGQWALPLDEVQTLPGCRQPKAADVADWLFRDKQLHNYPPSVAGGRYHGLKYAWLSPSQLEDQAVASLAQPAEDQTGASPAQSTTQPKRQELSAQAEPPAPLARPEDGDVTVEELLSALLPTYSIRSCSYPAISSGYLTKILEDENKK